MKLKTKSWMNWLLVAMWQRDSLPKSLCTYFWASLFTLISSILFLPILLLQRLIPSLNKTVDVRAAAHSNNNTSTSGVLIYILIYGFSVIFTKAGAAVVEAFTSYDMHYIWHDYIIGWFAGIISIGLGIGIIVLVFFSGQWLYNRFSDGTQALGDTVVGQQVKAVKSKVCPIIEYED